MNGRLREFCDDFPEGAMEVPTHKHTVPMHSPHLDRPHQMVDRALSYMLSIVMFLEFDLEHLIEGSIALLRLNSVLAVCKPLAAVRPPPTLTTTPSDLSRAQSPPRLFRWFSRLG